MARVHRYVAHDGSWSETIAGAIRIGTTDGGEAGERTLPMAADSGNYGTIEISIDDVDSSVGHDGDGIVGLQRWEIDETEAPAGNRRLWTGITDDRDYGDSPVLAALGGNVDIGLTAADINAKFGLRRFAPDDPIATRPEESCLERFEAVMASDVATGLLLPSATLIEIPSRQMDADKLHGRSLGDVLGDIGIQAGGLNFFALYNEADDQDEVAMFEPNGSTLYTSSFRISNFDDDIDDENLATQTTFAPTPGKSHLRVSPKKTGSRVDVPYKRGTERVVREATEEDFYRRDLQAPNATVKKVAKAVEIGNDFAHRSRVEEHVLDCVVPVTAAHVNDAREGQRIQVKFRQFRGYTDWRWVRIVDRDPVPWAGSQAGYDVKYKLVPQGTAPVVGDCTDLYPSTPSGIYYPLGTIGGDPFASNVSDGVVYYWRGGLAEPYVPTPGWPGRVRRTWHFPRYQAGGPGTIDYAGDCVLNHLILMTVGNGTWQIQTERYLGSIRALRVSKGPTFNIRSTVANINSGDSVEVTIDDATDGDCVRVVVITDNSNPICGSAWGWSAAEWTAA